jgi:GntR family transcriptional regulator, transcriptional repressor for pyruvate dehydrogenase complex
MKTKGIVAGISGDEAPRGKREGFITRLEELILSGRFPPGERLPPERELAEGLGASRPVVHAALGELAGRGLLRIESRRGAFVADWRREGSIEMLLSIMRYAGGEISPGVFDSLLELRLLFEVETARLAALRRSAGQVQELERVLARERLLVYEGPRDVTLLDYDFHLAVAIASGNYMYPLIMNSMKRIYETILDRFYVDESVVPRIFGLHRELVSAIAESKERKAVEVMRRILEYGESNLRRILGKSGGRKRPGGGAA